MTFMQNQDSELHTFKRRSLGREKSQPESPTQSWCCPSGSQMSSCGLFLSNMANSRFSYFSSFVGSSMSDRIERKEKSVRPEGVEFKGRVPHPALVPCYSKWVIRSAR